MLSSALKHTHTPKHPHSHPQTHPHTHPHPHNYTHKHTHTCILTTLEAIHFIITAFTIFISLIIYSGSVRRPTVLLMIFVAGSLKWPFNHRHQTESCIYCICILHLLHGVPLIVQRSEKKRRSKKRTKPGKSGINFGERILYMLVVIYFTKSNQNAQFLNFYIWSSQALFADMRRGFMPRETNAGCTCLKMDC